MLIEARGAAGEPRSTNHSGGQAPGAAGVGRSSGALPSSRAHPSGPSGAGDARAEEEGGDGLPGAFLGGVAAGWRTLEGR